MPPRISTYCSLRCAKGPICENRKYNARIDAMTRGLERG